MFNPKRARFLRGDQTFLPRPPGALTEAEFVERCTGCGVCVNACPVDAIQVRASSENAP